MKGLLTVRPQGEEKIDHPSMTTSKGRESGENIQENCHLRTCNVASGIKQGASFSEGYIRAETGKSIGPSGLGELKRKKTSRAESNSLLTNKGRRLGYRLTRGHLSRKTVMTVTFVSRWLIQKNKADPS